MAEWWYLIPVVLIVIVLIVRKHKRRQTDAEKRLSEIKEKGTRAYRE